MSKLLIIGVGNRLRQDDGLGPAAIDQLRAQHAAGHLPGIDLTTHSGEATSLIDAWSAHDTVILIDAIRATKATSPGTIIRFDAHDTPLPPHTFRSTHGFGVAEAIALAALLHRLPKSLCIYGVTATQFGFGEQLSQALQRALPNLIARVTHETQTQRPTP